jgi:pSer/pThr/pTyr-binding forkhead associated (FHA) protein
MFTLIIEDKYGAIVDEYSFEDGEFVIGRSQSCDIVLAADNVSRRHARLFTVEGRCYIEDLKAANGLWLNGKRVYNVTELPRSAQVRIGDFFLHIEGAAFERPMGTSPWGSLVPTPGSVGQLTELTRPTTLIGRGKDCTVVVNDPSVSRIHAKITHEADGRMLVEDLRSSNGVYVNERRIDVHELHGGDRVRFGTVGFQLQIDGEDHLEPPPEPAHVAARQHSSTGEFRAQPPISSYGNDYNAVGYYEQNDPYHQSRQRSLLPQVAMIAVAALSVVGLMVLAFFAFQRFVAPAIDESKERNRAVEARKVQDEAQRVLAEAEAEEAKQRAKIKKLFTNGKVAISKRKWDAAATVYKEARALDPVNTEPTRALNVIAAEKRAKRRFDKSEKAFAEKRYADAIRLHRRIPDSSVYRADADAALKAIAGVLEIDGDHACDKRKWTECKEKYSLAVSTTFASSDVEAKFAKVLKKAKRRRRSR